MGTAGRNMALARFPLGEVFHPPTNATLGGFAREDVDMLLPTGGTPPFHNVETARVKAFGTLRDPRLGAVDGHIHPLGDPFKGRKDRLRAAATYQDGIIGVAVEVFYGKWRYLVIYLGSGIVGGIVTYFLMPPGTLAAGASGAIFGVFGALGVFYIANRQALGRYGSGAIMNWLFWLGLNLVFGFSTPGIGISSACKTGSVSHDWGSSNQP